MAKGDIQTPPGTGHINTLTPDQKELLKQMWAELFSLSETGTTIADSALASGFSDINLNNNAGTETVKSKKHWFGSKGHKNEASSSNDKHHGHNEAHIDLAELGLDHNKIRDVLHDNVLGDHPDALLLRFLRARKWNVTNGLNMILKAFKWRADDDIAEVKRLNEDELDAKYSGFRKQLEMGKSYCHGTDKEGRPIVYIHVRMHKPSDQEPKAIERFTIYVMEIGRLLIQPPVETACLVFDMTGFALANMDYNFVKFLVQCFEAYYPESLGVLLIHKAPFVFWGIWKVIEPWLDPVVASKIRFTRNDKEILEVIDAEHLPTKYDGGKDNFQYKYTPVQPGENDRMKDTETKKQLTDEWKAVFLKFESVTKEWINVGKTEGGRSEAEIEAERMALSKELRTAYFKKDCYVRSRTLYHRTETPILHDDGSATWTYSN